MVLRPLERAIELALTAGLAGSAVLLLVGVAAGAPAALRWGILLLMVTPVARVLVLTLGLLLGRDWVFALISLFVLTVLLSGVVVSLRLGSMASTASPSSASPR